MAAAGVVARGGIAAAAAAAAAAEAGDVDAADDDAVDVVAADLCTEWHTVEFPDCNLSANLDAFARANVCVRACASCASAHERKCRPQYGCRIRWHATHTREKICT